MTRKKNLITFSTLSVALCLGVVGAIVFTANSLIPSKAEEGSSIVFNSGKNVITTSDTVKSEKGTSFTFYHYNVLSNPNYWQTVATDGYFSTKCDDSINKNAIFDMKTITFNFNKENLPFTIIFSLDGTFESGKTWMRSYKTKTGGQTIDFEGHPHYFKFVSNATENIDIIDMKIKYGCDPNTDTTWYSTHGVNPTISDKTVTYGLYPQKVVSPINEQTLIAELTAKANELEVSDEQYFWYNDEYYVKDKVNLHTTEYIYYFTDGTIVKNGDTHFFKCEPIKWNIKGTDTNYTIDCSNILYGHKFAESSNVYANSELRTWLNGDFYDKAFFLYNFPIVKTDLSDVGVSGEKVWVGSKTEYNSWYTSDDSRKKETTDYALCNGSFKQAMALTGTGKYWTRTAYEFETLSKNQTYAVDFDGKAGNCYVYRTYVGVSPSLTVKI